MVSRGCKPNSIPTSFHNSKSIDIEAPRLARANVEKISTSLLIKRLFEYLAALGGSEMAHKYMALRSKVGNVQSTRRKVKLRQNRARWLIRS
jgi:hypothetical protein